MQLRTGVGLIKLRVLHGQAGAGLALQQLDGDRLVVPVGPEQLDGAEGVGVEGAGGIDRAERAAAE